jgi:hypothetical protein
LLIRQHADLVFNITEHFTLLIVLAFFFLDEVQEVVINDQTIVGTEDHMLGVVFGCCGLVSLNDVLENDLVDLGSFLLSKLFNFNLLAWT